MSLPAPGARVRKGVRFTGHGYYKFPSSTHPVNTDFTGKCAPRPLFQTHGDPGAVLMIGISLSGEFLLCLLTEIRMQPFQNFSFIV